jgi:hypothetical protein
LNHGTGPNISFVRASAANYFNSAGVLTSAAVDEPRFDHDPVTLESKGLLVEVARTNLLLNSASLSTQSVVVTAVPYTLSFYGTGTITLSGVSTAGPLVGSGAFPTRSTLTFTPTAGTLTLTVTGTVEYAQLEAGSFASSYITTAGASATRSSDLPTVTPISSFYNQNEGTIFVQQSQAVISHITSFRFFEISNASPAIFRKPGMEIATNNLAVFSTLGGSPTEYLFHLAQFLQTQFTKLLVLMHPTILEVRLTERLRAQIPQSDVTGTTGTLTQGTTSLRFGALAALVPISFFIGSISSIILFNKALTDSETSSMYTLYSTTLGSGLGLP